eukprot:6661867-Pyramimonas_sp.AAC.1
MANDHRPAASWTLRRHPFRKDRKMYYGTSPRGGRRSTGQTPTATDLQLRRESIARGSGAQQPG